MWICVFEADWRGIACKEVKTVNKELSFKVFCGEGELYHIYFKVEEIWTYIYFEENLLIEISRSERCREKKAWERTWNRDLSKDGRINLQERQRHCSSETQLEALKLSSRKGRLELLGQCVQVSHSREPQISQKIVQYIDITIYLRK